MGSSEAAALDRLRQSEAAAFVSPSPELARLARDASAHLYGELLPFAPRAPPLNHLLVGDEFDCEQVWTQIDLLARPLLSILRRRLNELANERASPQPVASDGLREEGKPSSEGLAGSHVDEEDDDEEEELAGGETGSEEDDEKEEVEEEDEEEQDEEVEEERGGVEDKFLKIKELEEFLQEGEEQEYGRAGARRPGSSDEDDDNRDEGEDEGGHALQDGDESDDDDDDNAIEMGYTDEDTPGDLAEDARYEDFFRRKTGKGHSKQHGTQKSEKSKKKVHFIDEPQDVEMDNEQNDDENGTHNLSTHEKELQKMRSKIEQLEKANMEPKLWTMQGEVTATKRPKNSALEVDLDFEHNVRPPPVITEEVTSTIEDMIKKRILEGNFDDVQKLPSLPSKAPREQTEMDENKSKKGLAEIYEDEYARNTGLASAPITVSDQMKKEASTLFKKICFKLDALSHFHFAPKPVIEDMSIPANVPALAMEEIAPVSVSDAAMLAPEEVFEGKGDVKEEGELTQADRRRRRAKKKRKYKARTAQNAKKPRTQPALKDTVATKTSHHRS